MQQCSPVFFVEKKKGEVMATPYELVMESRRELVEKIVAEMEKGIRPSKALWQNHISQRPYNPLSGYLYRGGNWMRLAYTAKVENYEDPRWMTYKQAKDAGYQVRRGEKSVLLEKWIFEKTRKVKNEQGEIEEIKERLEHPIVNYFRVFNAEQMDGIEPLPEVTPMEHNQMLQTAEDFMKSSECEILEVKQDWAFYDSYRDRIVLPPRDYFKNQESFLSVVLHEMAHSTGHESRFNRPMMGAFGTREYAKEELNAELSSAFIQDDLGIRLEGELMEDHAGYLASWIQVLRDDPNVLFQAVKQADRISEFLVKNYEQSLSQERVQDKTWDLLSDKGNAIVRIALKHAQKAGTVKAGLQFLEQNARKFPEDREGNRLVKEIYLKEVQQLEVVKESITHEEFSKDSFLENDAIIDEAAEYNLTPAEFEEKIKVSQPVLEPERQHYDTAMLIQNTVAALDANAEQDLSLEIE